jgi:nitroreductase
MIRDLIIKNRSYRRFYQEFAIEYPTLRELVDLARLSSSAANLQPLKYILSCEPKKNALIFPHLGWAGYLKDWHGPAEGERPSAYIIVLADTEISRSVGFKTLFKTSPLSSSILFSDIFLYNLFLVFSVFFCNFKSFFRI